MKVREIDWRYFSRGMVLPAIAVVAGLVVFGLSVIKEDRAALTLGAAQENLAERQLQRNQTIGAMMAEKKFAAGYSELVSSGALGDERRLERIQALRDAVEMLKLPYARYTISSQRAFSASYLPAGLAAPVYASQLELQVGLGHEVDLLRLIRKLGDDPGLFHVKHCELTRVSQTNELSASQPNLIGECSVDWLTVPVHTMSGVDGAGI